MSTKEVFATDLKEDNQLKNNVKGLELYLEFERGND